MIITKDLILRLREKTGAGIVECKVALQESDGDLGRAEALIGVRGAEKAAKRSGRAATQGIIATYVHGGRIGALVELNCETDFVSRTEEFQKLGRELAMQVTASAPRWVRREDVPAATLAAERPAYATEEKFFAATCLVDQPYIRDEKRAIRDLLNEVGAKTGERVDVRRFTRFQLGEA